MVAGVDVDVAIARSGDCLPPLVSGLEIVVVVAEVTASSGVSGGVRVRSQVFALAPAPADDGDTSAMTISQFAIGY